MTHEGLTLSTSVPASAEAMRVQQVLNLAPDKLTGPEMAEYEAFVTIVGHFSRDNPLTQAHEVISPGRVATIPTITARYLELVQPARGELSLEEVTHAWFDNTPENDGTRHPDLLFDIAQYNFGSDEPLNDVVRALTLADVARKVMRDRYRQVANKLLTTYRYHRDLSDDTTDEQIDELADQIAETPLF